MPNGDICNIEIKYFYMEKISSDEWKFKKDIISWAMDNGGELNAIENGQTLYETFLDNVENAREVTKKEESEALESINKADEFAEWLKSIGAITAAEQHERIEAKINGLSPKEVLELTKYA